MALLFLSSFNSALSVSLVFLNNMYNGVTRWRFANASFEWLRNSRKRSDVPFRCILHQKVILFCLDYSSCLKKQQDYKYLNALIIRYRRMKQFAATELLFNERYNYTRCVRRFPRKLINSSTARKLCARTPSNVSARVKVATAITMFTFTALYSYWMHAACTCTRTNKNEWLIR